MTKNLSPEQRSRRRAAANELRQRAAEALEQASELDGWPVLHLRVADEARIAAALGISVERLHTAVETLMPSDADDTQASSQGKDASEGGRS